MFLLNSEFAADHQHSDALLYASSEKKPRLGMFNLPGETWAVVAVRTSPEAISSRPGPSLPMSHYRLQTMEGQRIQTVCNEEPREFRRGVQYCSQQEKVQNQKGAKVVEITRPPGRIVLELMHRLES